MPLYLISFDAHAMNHIPAEDMPAVTDASLAVVQEAINAGVWVFGGGLENQKTSIVATDGTVTDGPYPEAIGGLCVVDVRSREEALEWAAKIAVACRCARRGPWSSCPTRPWKGTPPLKPRALVRFRPGHPPQCSSARRNACFHSWRRANAVSRSADGS